MPTATAALQKASQAPCEVRGIWSKRAAGNVYR